MAKSMKRTSVAWSQDEIKLLRKLHQTEDPKTIADKLGRSANAVSCNAIRIGLRKIEPPSTGQYGMMPCSKNST
jgi:hypothetical protein